MSTKKKNRLLTPITGGVCAPAGFTANAVSVGIFGAYGLNGAVEEKEDIALIVARGRYPTACTYSQNTVKGAPVIFTQKHLKGYARAVFVNSGVANVCVENGEKIAETICDALAKRLKISRDEIVIASTGEVAPAVPTERIIDGIDGLVNGLTGDEEGSLRVARAIVTTDFHVKQIAFSFMLGDYPCKIGAVFKGNKRFSPHMATALCFLTTDVAVSSEMLQRALSAAVNETFNQSDIDGISSPNDTICIMASGLAGNYKISCVDTEYKKFYNALLATLSEICKSTLKEHGALFYCKVAGAKSKRVARALARAIAKNEAIKARLQKGIVDVSDLVGALSGIEEPFLLDRGRICLCVGERVLVLFEEGKPLCVTREFEVLSGEEEIGLRVEIEDGNYGALAYSIFKRR